MGSDPTPARPCGHTGATGRRGNNGDAPLQCCAHTQGFGVLKYELSTHLGGGGGVAATRRNMQREERVTVQGPVKEQQPNGMSHGGGGRVCPGKEHFSLPPPPFPLPPLSRSAYPSQVDVWACVSGDVLERLTTVGGEGGTPPPWTRISSQEKMKIYQRKF